MSDEIQEGPFKNAIELGGQKETLVGFKTHEVNMSTFKRLDIPPGDNKTYVIRTVARIGCDAVLIWRIDPKGNEEVLMTHYPPTEINKHLDVLRQSSPHGDGIKKAVFLTAGKEPAESSRKLIQGIEDISGTTPDVVRIIDDTLEDIMEKQKNMNKDYGAYQLIATKGYNGKPDLRRVIVPKVGEDLAYQMTF